MLGPKLAFVLRSKNGGNFLVQTHGIPGKTVQDAVNDALETFGTDRSHVDYYPAPDFQDPSGDLPPNLALGQIPVLKGHFLVTYRLVSSVLVMLISESHTNAFMRLRLLDAAAKILVGASKGVDVTTSSLTRRYADVHSLLGNLLVKGLAELPPAFIHTSATDEKLVAVPLSASDAARRLKRLAGGGGKGSVFVPEKQTQDEMDVDPVVMPLPETPTKGSDGRSFTAEIADPLNEVEFVVPADALPPPPARAFGAMRRPPAPPAVKRRKESLPKVFAGAVEEEVVEAEGTEEEKPAPVPKEWTADFGNQEGLSKREEDGEPKKPTVTLDDLRESLHLVETYRGEVRGGMLVRAGVEGCVRRKLAPYGLLSAQFRVLHSPHLSSNVCLWVARTNKNFTRRHEDNDHVFDAVLSGAPMDEVYLKYQLPSTASDPPIQTELLLAPQAGTGRKGLNPSQYYALIILRWSVKPDIWGPLLDVVVDVDLPAELSELVKVSPAAQFSKREGRLRWYVGRLEAGSTGAARAVLSSKAGEDYARKAEKAIENKEISAKVLFTCWPGQALSGLGFEVAMPPPIDVKNDAMAAKEPNDDIPFFAGKTIVFGELLIKP